MNSKGHLILSLIKSGIRMFGCSWFLLRQADGLAVLAGCFLLAESLGVIEELVDDRK